MKKISCIIPAYNEEKNIGNIISKILPFLGEKIYEIIVVDDCSEDKTSEVVKNFFEVKYLKNEENLGKSKTVAKGIENSSGNYIFLIDADLENITEKNISDFLEPILSGKSDISFAFLKNSFPLFPFKKIDYCSGQRIIPKDILMKNISEMKKLKSYGLEVFINKIIIKNKQKISVIKWENVENSFHHKKDGFLIGRKKNLKIWQNILQNGGGIIGVYKMNLELEKLLNK